MQSEFASHIGMSGRCFCRVCNVSGADAKSRAPGRAGEIHKVAEFMKVRQRLEFLTCNIHSSNTFCRPGFHVLERKLFRGLIASLERFFAARLRIPTKWLRRQESRTSILSFTLINWPPHVPNSKSHRIRVSGLQVQTPCRHSYWKFATECRKPYTIRSCVYEVHI